MRKSLGGLMRKRDRYQNVTRAAVSWLGALAILLIALTIGVFAQQQGTPETLPRPDFHFPGNVGRTYKDSDPPQFPQPAQAPKGAPNIVLILIDDAGFGQFSTF